METEVAEEKEEAASEQGECSMYMYFFFKWMSSWNKNTLYCVRTCM